MEEIVCPTCGTSDIPLAGNNIEPRTQGIHAHQLYWYWCRTCYLSGKYDLYEFYFEPPKRAHQINRFKRIQF